MRVILRLQAVLLCVLCVGFGCPAHADTGYGCATEGGGNNDDCTTLSPLPWRYTACDDAGTTAARQADWCFAFGGTGDATRCSADEHFSDANIAPVSTNFEHIVHGCETPSMSDTGWGQTVDSLNCQVGGPTLEGGLLIEDHRLLTFTGHEVASACVKPFSERVFVARYRDLTCPAGYQRIKIDADHDFCLRTPSCPCHIVSNPTRVSDGQKIYWETDLAPVGGGLLQYKRVYRSGGRFQPWQAAAGASEEFWESNFDSRLFVLDPTRNVVPYLVSAPEGTVRYFDANGSEYLHYGRAAERLSMQRNASGQIAGYVRTLSDDSAETFAPDGRLMRYDDTQGHALTLAYDAAARLSSVTDERGRTLRFEYNAAGQRTAVVAPDGTRIAYAYGANANLQSVTYADGAVRSYRYENTAFPHALTGIGDENGADYAAYIYDSAGRVQDTRHAPALAGGAIEHFHFSYDTNTTTITEPLGQAVTYTFALAGGVKNLASLSGPCGGCGEPFAAVQYDSAGYFSRATDFNGNSTTYVYDDSRGLETSRTEALGTSAQRTVTTVPDAQLRKPALRTVSNTSGDETRSAWQYNARGQTIAQCQIDPNDPVAAAYTCSRDSAPPTGAAVRRWTYRYCESDDIAAGTCPLPGLLVSSDGPRTDVADVTSYAYYDTTDASGCGVPAGQCHARGDLKSVTNALGQVTSYIAYDALGHAVRIKDANGTTIDFAYQARGWLASRTVRANADGTPNSALDASTTIGYDAAGNITRVTQPDGTYLQYGYDAAHRLTDVYDSATPSNYLLGDHIQYTLDAAGNRIDEKTSDPNGVLKRELARTYDRLNRLTAVLNSANAAVRTFANAPDAPVGTTSVDGYDPNGNALYSFDGSTNRIATAQQYDPLNRLLKTLQDRAGSGATHDTQTLYAYDTRNNLRSVTDPDGLVTNYTYDALENLTDLSSPDTGHTAYGYDSTGNRQAQTDARGTATAYRYDALNRLTAIVYPTTSLNVTYVYDQPVTGCFNVGRLTQLIDSSGSTQYCYDRRGNVTSKTQNTTEQRSCATTETGCGSVSAKGLTLPPTNPMLTLSAPMPVKYAYTLGDRVAAITYPSGAVVSYARDAVGLPGAGQRDTHYSSQRRHVLSVRSGQRADLRQRPQPHQDLRRRLREQFRREFRQRRPCHRDTRGSPRKHHRRGRHAGRQSHAAIPLRSAVSPHQCPRRHGQVPAGPELRPQRRSHDQGLGHERAKIFLRRVHPPREQRRRRRANVRRKRQPADRRPELRRPQPPQRLEPRRRADQSERLLRGLRLQRARRTDVETNDAVLPAVHVELHAASRRPHRLGYRKRSVRVRRIRAAARRVPRPVRPRHRDRLHLARRHPGRHRARRHRVLHRNRRARHPTPDRQTQHDRRRLDGLEVGLLRQQQRVRRKRAERTDDRAQPALPRTVFRRGDRIELQLFPRLRTGDGAVCRIGSDWIARWSQHVRLCRRQPAVRYRPERLAAGIPSESHLRLLVRAELDGRLFQTVERPHAVRAGAHACAEKSAGQLLP